MPNKWERPADVPLPSVWRRFAGVRPMPDGRIPNFWIQDVMPDMDDQIVDFMCDSFLKEEPMCSMAGILDDPRALELIRSIWHRQLQQRAGLVAFSDWPDGPDKPRLAGCNVTCVTLLGDHLPQTPSPQLNNVLNAMDFIEEKVDVFERYGVDSFLNAFGLSVAPDFRGQELGRELLLARSPLGRALGLRLTVTVFSGTASQKQSARAGFELLAEQRYDDYRPDGQIVFKNAPCDTFQLKAKRIEEEEQA